MTNCLSPGHECCLDTLRSVSLIPGCPAIGESWYCLSIFCFSSSVGLLDSSSAEKVDLSMNSSDIACFGLSSSLSLMNFQDKASAVVFLLPAMCLILIL